MSARILLQLLVAAILVGCGPSTEAPSEEVGQALRERIGAELARRDREAALAAVRDLEQELPDTPEALLEIARWYQRAGDASRASWLLEPAVRRFPSRDDLRLALARVSLVLGNPARAREAVLPVDEAAAEHPAALVLRAQAELLLGDIEQALRTLTEAETRYPDRPEARLVRIQTLLSEKRTEEARAAIEEARAELAGEDEEAVALRRRLDVTLAQLEAEAGEVDAALARLEGLLAQHPNDVLAWRLLAQLLLRAERGAEAVARLQEAAAAEGADAQLYAVLAEVHVGLRDESAAEAALETLAARSDLPGAIVPLFEFYSRRSLGDEALAALDQGIERHPEEATLRLLRSEVLLAESRLDEAAAEIERFEAQTFAGDPQVDYLEVRLQLAQGDAGDAVERLRALAPELDTAATHFWLGQALEISGDHEGARRRYSLAMQRDRSWVGPPLALMVLEQRRGNWRGVVANSRAVITRNPQEIAAWAALVEALERLGEGEAAEAVAKQCLERFPERAEAHAIHAKALRAGGDTDGALAELDRAQTLAPSAALRAERILTLGIGGRVAEGVAEADAALREEPDAALLHAASASLRFAAGDVAGGDAATERALALDPDDPRPLRVRCEFRASRQDWPGARDDCTRYLAERPDDGDIQFVLGVAQQSLGESGRAEQAYRRAAALDERDIRSRNNLAELLAQGGDLDGALTVAQEAYRLDEGNPYLLDTLGGLYLRKGLATRAVPLLEQAHAGLPEHSGVTLNLVVAYRDAGRGDEAGALIGELDRRVAPGDPLRGQVDAVKASLP